MYFLTPGVFVRDIAAVPTRGGVVRQRITE